jgi:hypothetical protein
VKIGEAWAVASAIGKFTWEGIKLIRGFRRNVDAIPPTEPDKPPLPWTALEHQRAQERAAISHKVKP